MNVYPNVHNKNNEPNILILSPDSRQRFVNWIEEFINSKKLTDFEESILSKLEATCARFALLFHITDSVADSKKIDLQINTESMEKAIVLVEYFYNNFKKVLNSLNNEKKPENSRELGLLKQFADNYVKGIPISSCVIELKNIGYQTSEIAAATNKHRNTIINWNNKKEY